MSRLILLPLLGLLLSSSASAKPEPVRLLPPVRPLHWAQFPVRVFVPAKDAEQTQNARLALAGLDEWVDAAHGRISYVRAADPNAADIVVRFLPGTYLSAAARSVGETKTISSGPVLKKAEIRLAEDGAAPEELQSAAAHEFGHALGIQGHSDNPDDLMFPVEIRYYSAAGGSSFTAAHKVTAHDLRLLSACYPALLAGFGP